jgi:hypothetical protein
VPAQAGKAVVGDEQLEFAFAISMNKKNFWP